MGPLRTVAWLFGVGVSVSFAQPAPPGPGSYPAIVPPPPQPPQPPQPQPPHTSQIKPPAVADESFCKVLAAQQNCPAYTDNGCKSTKEAIEGSVSGTVWLRESVNLTQTIERKGPLTLFGCNQTWTCTDTARTALTVNPRDETTDTNITIIDITVQYCLEQGLVLKGTNVEIRDSEFRHNGGNPENRKLGVCVAVDAAQALVKDCVFYENSCSDDSAQRGGGLYMAENGRLTVSQSVFVLNHCAAGGGIFSKSPAVVTDCIFSNNTASRSGGAFGSTSSLVVRHSKFVDNGDSQVTGGAIFVYSGFDMTNCTLLHNVAEAGGGVFTNDGDVFIRDSKFKDNKGVSSGGAVYCNGGINATNTVFEGNSAQDGGAVQALLLSNLTACTFTKNAAAKGGAVYLETGEGDSEEGVAYGPTLRDCVFAANTAEAEAGAVYVNGGPLTAINSTFEDNAASGTAKGGGAVQALSGGTIKGCSFVGNSASEGHGGALNAAGNITIINTRFIDNDASVGGAISIDDGSLRLEYSSMTGNKANSTGGAVAATGEATLTVVGSRAAENYAGTKGGAFYCLSQMAVTASTFMCNRAGQRGGAFDLFSLNLNLARDVIITSNSAPSCPSHTWGDGLSCISGANNTCKCKWGQEEAKRLCAGHGTCTNNNNTGAISCACSSGYFLNDTKCTACSTCGQSPVLHPCVPTVDTVCACPDGKTGRGCNQTCQLPPNCSSGDTSKCAFSQFVFHQNVTCTQCQPGYFVGKNGSCKKCSGCGSNGWQKAACTATTDTVCRCPMGRTGDKCEALCEQPEGCAALVWEMINNCTYDAEDYSKGVPCLACRHGYYLGPDNHCSAYTTCNKGQYEKVPPTNSTDRVCAYLTLCGATQYERIPPTPTSDRVCANCSLASDCTTVVSACNATNDLVCKQPCKDGRTGPACQYQVVSITLSEDCGTFTDAQATEYLKQLALALKVNQSDMVLLARSCGSVVLAVGMPDSAVEDLNNRAKNGDSTLPGGIVSVQPSGQPATIITRASTETDSSLPVGVIVGIVAASLVAVVAAIVATYFWYQRRSQIRRERDKTVDALIAEIQKKYKWTDANSVEASKKLSTVEHTVGWLPRSGFAILDVLGRGAFGHVSRGVVFVEGAAVVCAVKQLIPGDGTQDFAKESENFLREAQMLRELDHPNIVRMIGASMDDPDPTNPTGGSVYMLLEFMDLGDLKSYLQHNVRVGEVVSLAQRLWFCQEIARGLSYLASIPIVHRDIAARNVLLRSPLTLGDFPITKISDMGLARIVGQSNYVKQSDGGILPVRWMAPETLASQGVYSEASDVWGFAVCVWEIFSDGAVPFEFCDNTKFLAIQRHAQLRLNKPALCPENVYNVTAQCWEVAPEKRPTFAALKTLYENFFRTECPNYGEESMGYDRIVPASSARVQAAMGGLKPAKGGSDGGYSHLTEGSDSGQAPLLHKGSIRGSSRRGGYSTVTEGVNPDDDYVERTGYVVIEPRRNPASDQSATETPEHSTAIMMTERERSSSVGQRRTSITAPPPALPKTRGLKPTQSGSLIEDDKANLLGSKSDV